MSATLPYLKPASVLAERKPHGTRVKYMGGCHCVPCRAANSRYECRRAELRRLGLWNGLVPAEASRKALLRFSLRGIGRNTVAKNAGVSRSVIWKIRTGKARQVRAMTEKRILELGPSLPPRSKLVAALPTWRKIAWLLEQGFTRGELALRLGRRTRNLQLNRDVVTQKTADAVEKLYREMNI
jgi:hypothetical protein